VNCLQVVGAGYLQVNGELHILTISYVIIG